MDVELPSIPKVALSVFEGGLGVWDAYAKEDVRNAKLDLVDNVCSTENNKADIYGKFDYSMYYIESEGFPNINCFYEGGYTKSRLDGIYYTFFDDGNYSKDEFSVEKFEMDPLGMERKIDDRVDELSKDPNWKNQYSEEIKAKFKKAKFQTDPQNIKDRALEYSFFQWDWNDFIG